jgi:hypothetical protein
VARFYRNPFQGRRKGERETGAEIALPKHALHQRYILKYKRFALLRLTEKKVFASYQKKKPPAPRLRIIVIVKK